ncbi:MAG: UDP-N-acetylglucosamine 2-epimerase [bacterium]|nr:UDP-N-acetylglucosamine 2-epimerase [bacterium]
MYPLFIKEVPRRKICFVLTSKIHYARSKFILYELKKLPSVELQIVIAGSAILKDHGDIETPLVRDGFEISAKITMTVQGGGTVAMAKTTGLGIIEFASVFENLNPDLVVLRGDRFEVLSAAVAAAYMNKTIAHIEGGDVSGNIDESVRHAITKLAHLHFVSNEVSRKRVIAMGENPDCVWNVGASDVELANLVIHGAFKEPLSNDAFNEIGEGASVDIAKPFLIVMQHPVTSELEANYENMIETIEAVHALAIPSIFFWSNTDAGQETLRQAIADSRERGLLREHGRFISFIEPAAFLSLLYQCACLVGNSSSGIKECSYLGVPVVNIGTRQGGRMRDAHVLDVGYNKDEIKRAIESQLSHGRYPKSTMYHKKDTSKTVARMLVKSRLHTQKRFFE